MREGGIDYNSTQKNFGEKWESSPKYIYLSIIIIGLSYPNLGPVFERSNTCLGLSSHWKVRKRRAPWLPPLLGLMKTRRGFWC